MYRYLWREDDTLKTIHDLKWYGNLPGELLFLTNEYIIFMVPGEDNCPTIVQVRIDEMTHRPSPSNLASSTLSLIWIWLSNVTLALLAVG